MRRILPILFNTEMTKATLDGRKTVTRRIIKPNILEQGTNWIWNPNENVCYAPLRTGDILYVRETWLLGDGCGGEQYYYKADETESSKELRIAYGYKWRPSIHMPKEAARIWLEVTAVRAERLRDITEEQARAEGCIGFHDKIGNGKFDDVLEFDLTARDAFVELWNSTLKKDSSDTWVHNPWVWVYEFERCEKPEGESE